jgi:hypothetical protein
MTIEVDIALLKKFDISIESGIILHIIANNIKITSRDFQYLIEHSTENIIDNLIDRQLIVKIAENNYVASDDVLNWFESRNSGFFDQLILNYPKAVTGPDGMNRFLLSNKEKCKKAYNKICKQSANIHEHIMECLKLELDERIATGKLGYMKTLWKWLTQREWECYEDITTDNSTQYGTTII